MGNNALQVCTILGMVYQEVVLRTEGGLFLVDASIAKFPASKRGNAVMGAGGSASCVHCLVLSQNGRAVAVRFHSAAIRVPVKASCTIFSTTHAQLTTNLQLEQQHFI
eukprot:2756723-Amphidinium_carterae.1